MTKVSDFSGLTAAILASGLLLLTACGTSQQTRALGSTANVIGAAYASLADSAGQLNKQAGQYCNEANQSGLDATRAAWQATMDAWMRVQPISFGPIRTLDLAYKIQFWPDPRDMVGQQTQAQLAQASKDAAEMQEKIAGASVAVHGLPAIEALLYPDEAKAQTLFSEPAGCQLLQAITANLVESTSQLASAWSAPEGYARKLTQYGQDAPYADANAALSALLASLVQSLQFVTESKLAWPLGVRADGVPQPFRVESRRSLRSLQNIHANLAGAEQIFTAGDQYGLQDYLRSLDGGAQLADDIAQTFSAAQRQAAALAPFFPALQSGDNLDGYRQLLQTTGRLTELFGEKLPDALGVSGGINFNDGD